MVVTGLGRERARGGMKRPAVDWNRGRERERSTAGEEKLAAARGRGKNSRRHSSLIWDFGERRVRVSHYTKICLRAGYGDGPLSWAWGPFFILSNRQINVKYEYL